MGPRVLRTHAGTQVAGVLHSLAAGPVTIPARKCLHSTEPWSGSRVVLIAYAGGDHHAMSIADRSFLQALDFPLPVDAGTDCPPVPWHPSVPPDLQPFLNRVQARVAGRSLSQLVFLEFSVVPVGFALLFANEVCLAAEVLIIRLMQASGVLLYPSILPPRVAKASHLKCSRVPMWSPAILPLLVAPLVPLARFLCVGPPGPCGLAKTRTGSLGCLALTCFASRQLTSFTLSRLS